MAPKREGPLAAAARTFEAELARYEDLSAEIERTPITSEKALVRAKRQLGESAECQARLAEHLQSVVRALEGVRTRQDASMQRVVSAVHRVEARTAEFVALMERFSALGLRAREVNEPVAHVVARKSQGAPAEELLAGLHDVLARTEAIVADAEALSRDATSVDWADVARDVDSLKQQVQSARNRVLLAQRTVSERAPS